MSRIEYEVDINAPVERVYEYYTNPDNIKEAWPKDVVKESESITDSKNEPGSEMKVKGEYMGRKAEMLLEVAEKEPNSRTHVRHTIDYELGTLDKAGNFVTGSQADDKIKQGLQQSAQTVKQKLESQ
jgi:uncharacterized protein YndB with AHSA1/START domain